MRQQYLTIFLIFSILIWSCNEKEKTTLPYYNTPDFTPHWLDELPSNFHQIRAFELQDQKGESFTEKDMDGKICVVDFFFTQCPGICPKMTVNMAKIQDSFLQNKDVLLLSHSVTPETDSSSILQKYAQDKGVNYVKWRLLTGAKAEIYDLGRRYYFVEEDEGVQRKEDVFLHTENFILVDKQRHLRGIYNGIDIHSMQDLIRDIQKLQSE